MKTKKPAASPNQELKSLRKEVETLKKQLARMQKTLLAAAKPGRLRATKLVVDSLEVVNASGKVVASIDKSGNLFCATVWASTDRNKRGVFIDGVTYRKVSAGMLELIPPTGNAPGLEAQCSSFGGSVTLRSLIKGSKQLLMLQGTGAPLLAYDDEHGSNAVVIRSNGPSGGGIDLLGTAAGSKAAAKVRVSHLTGAGAVSLMNSAGKTVGQLP